MASTLTKNINSKFNPVLLSGYPIYAYGGYPQMYGFGSWLKHNAGTIGAVAGTGLGALVGMPGLGMQLGSTVGGAVQQGAEMQDQQEQAQQMQKQQLNQQMASNLPAQPSYTPTFGGGGNMNFEPGSLIRHWGGMYANGGDTTPKDFTLNYIQSPKYKERLTSSGYDINTEIPERLDNVQDISTYGQYGAPSLYKQAQFKLDNRPYTSTGGSAFLPGNKSIIVDYKQAKDLGINPTSIESHEFGHGEVDSHLNGDTRISRLNPQDVSDITGRLKETANPVYKKAPDEIKADLNALRYELKNKGLYDAGTQDFNQDILNKMDKSYIRNRLGKAYSDEDLIWLMNNIAKVNQPSTNIVAATGGLLTSYEGGGGLSRSSDYGSSEKPYPSVASSDFAGGGRSYPIPTHADAVDALRLAGLHGRSDVKAKVYAKYPDLKKANGGSIHINPANKGKFTATKQRTGKTTEELTHSKNPLTRKRAIFAQNAAKWHHADGGLLNSYAGGGAFSDKISTLVHEGYPQKQAVAIAYSMQDRGKLAMGGEMDNITDRLTEFKNGGMHENNIHGGIPVGNNALTEEGEFMYTTKKGKKYIFSNRF